MTKYKFWCNIELTVPVEVELDKNPGNLTFKEWSNLLEEVQETFIDNINEAEVIDAEIEYWEPVAEEGA